MRAAREATRSEERAPPVTPDGRYIVVRGRLWRRSNPHLSEADRRAHVGALMAARSRVGAALKVKDAAALASARRAVDAAKIALGERGPVWWDDDEDLNRRMVHTTRYADWYAALDAPDGVRRQAHD